MGRRDPPDSHRAREESTLTAFLDTNVVIRHLTGDPPEMAARATALLAEPGTLLLVDLVLAECVYVLESFYEVRRDRVAELMRAAIALPSVQTIDADLLLRALEVYEVERLDFAEAYLVAQAEATGVGEIASFDRSIDRVATISRREP
ncbi:MAG TPA: PIN domain-containing protein [Solirubrobacteraceae bacterium]|nr:PIN domain-containing protein [Solirubrobacteraceae bacterium]